MYFWLRQSYWHSEMKRKASISFAFPSFFRNFVRICRISLNKGSLGIEKFLGYELETVLNSTFYNKLLNALGFAASLEEEHPMKSQQPFHDFPTNASFS